MKCSLHLLNLLNISCVKSCKIQWRFLRNSFLFIDFFLSFGHYSNHLFIATLTNLGSVQLAWIPNFPKLFVASLFLNDGLLTLHGNSPFIFLTVKNTLSFWLNTWLNGWENINVVIAFTTNGLLWLHLRLIPVGSSGFSSFRSLFRLSGYFLPFMPLFSFCSISVMNRPGCLLLWLSLNWEDVISLLFVSVTGWGRLTVIGYTVVRWIRDFKKLFRALQNYFGVWSRSSFFCISSGVTKRRLCRRSQTRSTILIININSRPISQLRRQPAFLILNGCLSLLIIFNNLYFTFLRRLENSHIIFPCNLKGSIS